MPRINLLPWREQERKVRRREFMVAAGGAVIASIVLLGVGKLLYAGWTEAQIDARLRLKMLYRERLRLCTEPTISIEMA